MATVEQLQGKITIDISDFNNKISNADKQMGRFEKAMSGSMTKITGLIKTGMAAAGAAMLGLGAYGLKTADDFEKANLKYETLLGSQVEAIKRVDELKKFSASTPFELDGIMQADILLQGFGIRSEKLLTTVGDAAAISGSGFKDLSLIIGQLSQSKDLENIKQLVERGVVSFAELEQAGISFAKNGSVVNSVEETYGAVVSIMENKFGGGMERLSGTLSGEISTLKDNFGLAMGQIATDSGLLDFAIAGIDKLIGVIETVDFSTVLNSVAGAFDWLTNSFQNSGASIDSLMPTFEKINTFINDLYTKVSEFLQSEEGQQFMSQMWVTLSDIINGTIQIFSTLIDIFINLYKAIEPLLPLLGDGILITFQLLGVVIQNVGNFLKILSGVFSSTFALMSGILSTFHAFNSAVWQSIVAIFTGNTDKLGQIWGGFADRIKSIWSGVASVLEQSGKNIVNGLIGNINTAIKMINNLIEKANEVPGVNINSLGELPQFEEGGIVGGNSYTGDKIVARLNSGEEVLTRNDRQTIKEFISSLSGGINVKGSNGSNTFNFYGYDNEQISAKINEQIRLGY